MRNTGTPRIQWPVHIGLRHWDGMGPLQRHGSGTLCAHQRFCVHARWTRVHVRMYMSAGGGGGGNWGINGCLDAAREIPGGY